jgi:hypothetical protein
MDSADAPRQVGSGGAWRAGACRWEKTERIRVREHQGREVVSAADVARVDSVRWGPRRREGRAQTSMASVGSGLGACATRSRALERGVHVVNTGLTGITPKICIEVQKLQIQKFELVHQATTFVKVNICFEVWFGWECELKLARCRTQKNCASCL